MSYRLFGQMKRHLGRRRFNNRKEVETAVRKYLWMQKLNFCQDGISQLLPRWGKWSMYSGIMSKNSDTSVEWATLNLVMTSQITFTNYETFLIWIKTFKIKHSECVISNCTVKTFMPNGQCVFVWRVSASRRKSFPTSSLNTAHKDRNILIKTRWSQLRPPSFETSDANCQIK